MLHTTDEVILKFEDGSIKTFGRSMKNDVYIPDKDIKKEQFKIYNRNGECYIVDKGENPTVILA